MRDVSHSINLWIHLVINSFTDSFVHSVTEIIIHFHVEAEPATEIEYQPIEGSLSNESTMQEVFARPLPPEELNMQILTSENETAARIPPPPPLPVSETPLGNVKCNDRPCTWSFHILSLSADKHQKQIRTHTKIATKDRAIACAAHSSLWSLFSDAPQLTLRYKVKKGKQTNKRKQKL